MSDTDAAASREVEQTSVKVYVPRYQKERWREHADDLDMNQSEFVRTMVQAGRRGFEFEDSTPEPDRTEEGRSPGSDPGGRGLEDRVLDVLSDEGYLSWDELVAALSEDLEDRLEDALDSLQAANRVQHSGRRGGYTVTGGGDE
jgi:hypothetical protein